MADLEDTVEWEGTGSHQSPNGDIEGTIEWESVNEIPFSFPGSLNAWSYKRPITVNNTSGSIITDYQVYIELTAGNFTYAHANGDGSDIRCTDANGALIDFWIEEWIVDGTSKIWIEFDSIPTGENICGYIFYGNSEAESISDGDATFYFFDDFEGDSIDTDKWTGNTESATVASSILTFTGECESLFGAEYIDKPLIANMRVRIDAIASGKTAEIGLQNTNGMDEMLMVKAYSTNYKRVYSYKHTGQNQYTNITNDVTAWFDFQIKWKTDETKYYIDTILKATHTTYVPSYPLRARFYVYKSGGTQTIYCDYIYLRAYVTTEPTYIVGVEEEPTAISMSEMTSEVDWSTADTPELMPVGWGHTIEWNAVSTPIKPHAFVFVDIR